MGDLWIDMYNSKIIPHHGVLAATYAIFHSFLPLLRFKNGVFTEKLVCTYIKNIFSARWKNPSFWQAKG